MRISDWSSDVCSSDLNERDLKVDLEILPGAVSALFGGEDNPPPSHSCHPRFQASIVSGTRSVAGVERPLCDRRLIFWHLPVRPNRFLGRAKVLGRNILVATGVSRSAVAQRRPNPAQPRCRGKTPWKNGRATWRVN